jgi:hypothetical protein
MKKGLILTLATVAVALLSTVSYGYAPIIGNIPDVWIGNDGNADIPETVSPDLNFFRYTNAFNFDQYVSKDIHDEDQSTTNVRWSFLADSADLVTINGIESLSDASEALKPELVGAGKELTSYPNNNTPHNARLTSLATFRDIKDSPTTKTPPWDSPSSGNELNTIIAIYASNGTKANSRALVVRANLIDGIDKLSGVQTVYGPTAPGGEWTKLYPTDGMPVPAWDGAFNIATQVSAPGSYVGAIGNGATQYAYSSWKSPTTTASYVANQVYRAKYTIRTLQGNQNNVPNMRMFLQCTDISGNLAFAGGNRLGKGPSAPTSTPQVYNVYFGPPDVSSITQIQYVNLTWEFIAFAADESGTNYLDAVELQRFATPAKTAGTSVKTFVGASGFGLANGWASFKLTQAGSPPVAYFGDVTFAGPSAAGISITTPAAAETNGHVNWGQWGTNTPGVTFLANKLYRVVYTLSAVLPGTKSLGKVRVINNNLGGSWSAELDADSYVYTAQMPTPGGVEYDVWQESMPTLYSVPDLAKNDMTFIFDVADGNDNQSGITTLSKVEVLYYNIP